MTLKELCETISCRNSEQMPSASSGNDHSPEGGSKIGRTQLHTHDYLELAYIVSGEFSQKILGKTITFREGELCLIDKNCLHQDIMDTSPAVILFLGIANATFDDIMDCPLTEKRIAAFLSSALLKQKNLLQYLHFRPHDGAKEAMEDQLSQLLLELIRHDEAAPYICRGLLIRIFRCTEETREATLQKLQHMARTAYGAAPAFTVQLIVVSGILQWTYEAQVYVGEHEKRSAAKSHYSV